MLICLTTGMGDSVRRGICPLNFRGKNFWQISRKIPALSSKYPVKFQHFVTFSGKCHVKLGHFVTFSCIYFFAKRCLAPWVDWAAVPMCLTTSPPNRTVTNEDDLMTLYQLVAVGGQVWSRSAAIQEDSEIFVKWKCEKWSDAAPAAGQLPQSRHLLPEVRAAPASKRRVWLRPAAGTQ